LQVGERIGDQSRPEAAPLEPVVDLGVRERNRRAAELIAPMSDQLAVDADLIALALGIVLDGDLVGVHFAHFGSLERVFAAGGRR
jgi:hypothetical protein